MSERFPPQADNALTGAFDRMARQVLAEIRYPGARSKMADELIELNQNQRICIGKILGIDYDSILILKHRFYEKWGTSVLLKSKNDLKYTEANAGSGEIAVVQLVYRVMNLKENSLILLDEPEVSLHPSAQARIQEFLLEQIKMNKHQIVISTHSPALVKGLPSTAVKLYSSTSLGKFHIDENINYQEAFLELEEYVENKKIIICEDISAKNLIQSIQVARGDSEYMSTYEALSAELFHENNSSELEKLRETLRLIYNSNNKREALLT